MTSWPPESIERLLGGALGSVGSVELLLFLHRSGQRTLGIDELCTVLRSPRSWTERELGALVGARLVAEDGAAGWRYAPATPELAVAVDALARAWQRDSRRVSRWVFSSERR